MLQPRKPSGPTEVSCTRSVSIGQLISTHAAEQIPSPYPGNRNVVIKQPIGVVYVSLIQLDFLLFNKVDFQLDYDALEFPFGHDHP
jgi:hypothetical protein